MFVTKTSLPRRTFLRGLGVALGLPLLDAMVPALTAVGADGGKPEVPVRRHLRAARHDHGSVDAGDRRRARAEADHAAARAVQGADAGRQQPGPARGRVRHQPCGRACLVADGRAAEAHRRSRLPAWRHGRSSDRRSHRAGHDVPVAGGRDRRLHGAPRLVRAGLQLRVRQHAQLAGADDARCRWRSIRAYCSSGCSAAADTAEQRRARMHEDRSVLDFVAEDVAQLERGIGQNDRSRLGQYLDNVREVERRIQRAEKQAQSSVDVPDAPVGVPESYEEHVGLLLRSACAGLRDRPDARVHLHDGARAEPADVSAHQRDPAAPHAVAPCQQPGSHRRARAGQHLSRAAVRQVPGTAPRHTGRRRLAARPLDDSVRQRNGQRQRPRRVSAADAPRWWQGARDAATDTSRRPRTARTPT